MMARFEAFARNVESLCDRNQEKALKKWMDNQDVYIILNVSPRTWQTLGDTGKLAYTQMYSEPEDVERVINDLKPP